MQSHSRDGLLLKKQLVDQEGFSELVGHTDKLSMPSADGKMRGTEVVNMETVLRIVQSIPSKNAEPFKKWLAEVGAERIEEVNDPEIAIQRAIYNYRAKGHDDKWIQKRMQSVLNRKGLTSEWQRRGGSRMVSNTHCCMWSHAGCDGVDCKLTAVSLPWI